MYIKKDVRLRSLCACMVPALIICCDFFNSIKKEIIITSGNEGIHKKGSKHYDGEAFDIRTYHLSKSEISQFQSYFRKRCDSCFDLVIEKDHAHIEYDDSEIFEEFP